MESRGTLKLKFLNGKEITFSCDRDPESLRIESGGFSSKEIFETDFKNSRYKWKEKKYLSSERLESFGIIERVKIEILNGQYQ